MSRAQRWQATGQEGVTVWLTGLPASGKSTLAVALEARAVQCNRVASRLDGDNLRHGLNGDLGFSMQDRCENARRTAHVACLLAEAGVVAIVALVSPYAADRALARSLHAVRKLSFVEVFLDTPLAECERRDPKQLYARARRGELAGVTGVDAPYEPPRAAEVTVVPADAVDAAVDVILEAIAARA